MHNAWTTTRPVNTEKLQRAAFVLETLCDPRAELIFGALKEHQRTTFLEMMMYTGLNGDELEPWLEKLCDTGAVKVEEAEWQLHFLFDEERLSVLVNCARVLALGSTFSPVAGDTT